MKPGELLVVEGSRGSVICSRRLTAPGGLVYDQGVYIENGTMGIVTGTEPGFYKVLIDCLETWVPAGSVRPV